MVGYVNPGKSTNTKIEERIDFQRDPKSEQSSQVLQCQLFVFSVVLITALFTASFSNLHYNLIQSGCEAISGKKVQNYSKLPRIHVELFCNANEKSSP